MRETATPGLDAKAFVAAPSLRVGVRVSVREAVLSAPSGVRVRGASASLNDEPLRRRRARRSSPRARPATAARDGGRARACDRGARGCVPAADRRRRALPRRARGAACRTGSPDGRERPRARGTTCAAWCRTSSRQRPSRRSRRRRRRLSRRAATRSRALGYVSVARLRPLRHRGLPGVPRFRLGAAVASPTARCPRRGESWRAGAGGPISMPSTPRPAAGTPRAERRSSRTVRRTCAESPARPRRARRSARAAAGGPGRRGCAPGSGGARCRPLRPRGPRARPRVPTRIGSPAAWWSSGPGQRGRAPAARQRVRLGARPAREPLRDRPRADGPLGTETSFVFTGKGWGHGVGLCQVGASGMARPAPLRADPQALLHGHRRGVARKGFFDTRRHGLLESSSRSSNQRMGDASAKRLESFAVPGGLRGSWRSLPLPEHAAAAAEQSRPRGSCRWLRRRSQGALPEGGARRLRARATCPTTASARS